MARANQTSGRAGKDKGNRREWNTVKLLKELGLEARRIALSGSAEADPHDVVFVCPAGALRAEVKFRHDWRGFAQLKLLKEKSAPDCLFLFAGERCPKPMIAMDFDLFAKLVRR
jgi:Holliday junction resolvase